MFDDGNYTSPLGAWGRSFHFYVSVYQYYERVQQFYKCLQQYYEPV